MKLYDKPVIYFPKFYHPDPTVKRASGFLTPSLLIGMPVGFIRVVESKNLLSKIEIPQIRIDGNRGGAALAAAAVNALLRACILD